MKKEIAEKVALLTLPILGSLLALIAVLPGIFAI